MTSQFFIPKHDRALLRDVLASIPGELVELDVTIAKQARVEVNVRGRRPKRPGEHPWPVHVDAAAARDRLHATLVGWVRLVLEHRGMTYDEATRNPDRWLPLAWAPGAFVGPLQPGRPRPPAPPSTADLALWLRRHFIALAMTPGAEDALRDIQDARRALTVHVCPPAPRLPALDERRHAQARALQLNARGVAALAAELGEEYRNLTQRRVRYLADHGHIRPMPGLSTARVFVVGQVLDAHLAVPIRDKHAIGA